MIGSLVQYRSFIWRHARADLRHRYAGTGMGVVWNVIHPLAIITIYTIVFSGIYKKPITAGSGGKLPFTFYLCAGLFPWLAFCDCVSRGCVSFISNATYLKKLPIPEQVFVAQNAAASTLSLATNIALMLILALVLGWPMGWTWLLLPIPIIMLQLLGFGIGLLLGTLNVFFRDIAELVAISLQLIMWTVPIIWSVDIIHYDWVFTVLRWHPLMPSLSAIRSLFLYRELPPTEYWITMTAWPLGVCIIAYLVLQKLRPEIRDVI